MPHRCPNPGPKPGLGSSAFARRYSRSRVCFPFLWVLRCFSSPGSLLHPMHSDAGDPQSGPGCPIRRSQDHSSVTSFPGLFAGSHVLHRLSTPRHPPSALGDLVTPTRPRRQEQVVAGTEPTRQIAPQNESTPSWSWAALNARSTCADKNLLYCCR